jgi:exodeoxyribonuclease X
VSIVLFRSLDVETSKKDNGEVIEVGLTDVWLDTDTRRCEITPPVSRLFGLTGEMDPGAQGTHHITLEEIEGLPTCTAIDLVEIATTGAPQFLVGHNCAYEQLFWTESVMESVNAISVASSPVRWLDTFKASLRAWEEAPEHTLQALKYWRGLKLDPALALPAHRGGPDSYVGAHLMAELAKTELIRDLVSWTLEPRYYATCPLKKHKGQRWSEVPHGYLRWITQNADEFDLRYAALTEINRRAEASIEGAPRS